ncbi:transposase [Geminicoccaceae bacterium 1502E]|nr:transposase [Geminicoccaceae bacterium 1502E]
MRGSATPDDGLQPLQPLVPACHLATAAESAGGGPLGGRRKRRANNQAIGVSTGGRTTKIHLATDLLGQPLALRLTSGDTADIRVEGELLAATGPATRIIADCGYAGADLRREMIERGSEPLITGCRNRKRPVSHDTRA